MIIGQGQLDSILNSSSENRRAVIEEAAGVLKHRRRKERAERRLDATQENIERLGDLVREVRRQMRPLERQAVSARSYSDVEAELRAARRALFSSRLHAFESRRRALETDLAASATRERELRHELVTLDAQAASAAAEMASRREELLASTLGTLQGLAERARGTTSVIQERGRSLRQALVASADENVIATLEADAAKLIERPRQRRRGEPDPDARCARRWPARKTNSTRPNDSSTRRGVRPRARATRRRCSRRASALLCWSARSSRCTRANVERPPDWPTRAHAVHQATADHEAVRREHDEARTALASAVDERLERTARRRRGRGGANRPRTRRFARRRTGPRAPRPTRTRWRGPSTNSRARAARPSLATSKACSARSST